MTAMSDEPTEAINDWRAEFGPRLVLYQLDEQACQRMRQLWPALEPHLPAAIDEFIDQSRRTITHLTSIYDTHRQAVRNALLVHYSALLRGTFDQAYADACDATVRQLVAMGLDARARIFAGHCVLRKATSVIARSHWFSAATIAANIEVVEQAIMFDVAITVTMYVKAAAKSQERRRALMDQAVGDFGETIDAVMDAIKEASSSLTTTSTGLQQASQATLDRMAAASSALFDMNRSVDKARRQQRICHARSPRSAARPGAGSAWRARPRSRTSA